MIPDFDPQVGDIKTIWEPSRFDWVLAFALQALAGDDGAVTRLNDWLTDWLAHNPPYRGPNWKCGQETSIRTLHLLLAALWLDQVDDPCVALTQLIHLHLARIAPTLPYALAQNNNHGTSEVAALYMGGSWLHRLDPTAQANTWARSGRRWLEDRARCLIATDGSFSQYSVNYHRLMLDTLSLAEIWRRTLDDAPFSSDFVQRGRQAAEWLYAFVDSQTGDVPNLGDNDGAHLLPVLGSGYRDYRPSVQLAAVLFGERLAYAEETEPLRLFHLTPPAEPMPELSSQIFDQGGYVRLCRGKARVFVRYPRYRFRPGHADALHVDLWVDHENVLRDGGSYSYAAEAQWQSYFRGCAGHNTVQFDDRDQMPRLSRFLYGAWLNAEDVTPILQEDTALTFAAAYTDWQGACHRRKVCMNTTRLRVEDQIDGFRTKAVLRWRLTPGEWRHVGNGWESGRYCIKVHAEMPIRRMELVEGWESHYYLQRRPLPVLEVEATQPGRLVTEVSWSST
jgi:hypothetical protein